MRPCCQEGRSFLSHSGLQSTKGNGPPTVRKGARWALGVSEWCLDAQLSMGGRRGQGVSASGETSLVFL